jgi:hypothetical protein
MLDQAFGKIEQSCLVIDRDNGCRRRRQWRGKCVCALAGLTSFPHYEYFLTSEGLSVSVTAL